MTKPNTNKWEEEFDEKFVISENHFSGELKKLNGNALWTNYIQNPGMQEIKAFISNLLSQSRQEFAEELLEKIEKIKAAKVEGEDETINDVAFNTWNEAMNKVLEIIKANK